MIFVTGDIHGETRKISNAARRFSMTNEDTIIILGDVGMNYYGNTKGDWRRKKRLNSIGPTIFCIHGNHEMRPETIDTYREIKYRGGIVYAEDEFPNLVFAKDGDIYDFDGLKAIAIGGAYSVDKWYRLQAGLHWFPDEQPSDDIKRRVEESLSSSGWNIDIVFSHTCPTRYTPVEAFLPGLDQSEVDKNTEEWLDTIAGRLTYRKWFCGHWHIDKRVGSFRFLMNDFEEL